MARKVANESPTGEAPAPWAVLLLDRLQSLADEWSAMTEHPVLIGSAREKALARLIGDLLPRRFEILDGTMALVGEDDAALVVDDQLDLMVVETLSFPTLLRSGTTAIVLPESVRAVIEAKSSLERTLTTESTAAQGDGVTEGDKDSDGGNGEAAADGEDSEELVVDPERRVIACTASNSFLTAMKQLCGLMQQSDSRDDRPDRLEAAHRVPAPSRTRDPVQAPPRHRNPHQARPPLLPLRERDAPTLRR